MRNKITFRKLFLLGRLASAKSLRMWLLVGFCCGFMLLLLARLIDVQVLRGSTFRVAAEQNRLHSLRVPAERGLFLDRFGQPLVWNARRYFQVSDPKVLYPELIPIARNNALLLMATGSGTVVTDWVREYRWPESLSHVVGYVGKVTAEDLERGVTSDVSDQVGKMGLESTFQKMLSGKAGRAHFEVNALGQRQRVVSTEQAEPGTSLKTTLDPYLSEVAYRLLGGKRGSVVVLDAENGEVLVVVSSPSFNANVLSQPKNDTTEEVVRRQQISQLFSDPRLVFFNRAVSGNYPPGSIFKLITALAGLETNAITGDTVVVDEGILKVGEYQYGNWYFRQYGRTEGPISIVRAIARSNDIYFYKAAEWIGPDKLAEMARLFGLGTPTGIELGSEAKGLVPDPAWKAASTGEQWYLGNTYHYGIGQGDLLVTPMQMAEVIQALAHNGLRCQPSLRDGQRPLCTQVTINDQSWQLVLRGMLDACSTGGTAFPFFSYNQERRVEGAPLEEDVARGAMACKTGTAEFGGADERGYRKTHAWFVGTAHVEVPAATSSAKLVESSKNAFSVISPTEPVPYLEWQQLTSVHPLPESLVFVAMVESDEQQPYQEGSRDAAPIIKHMIDWMQGKSTL